MEDKKSKELLEMEEHKALLEKLSMIGAGMTTRQIKRKLQKQKELELEKQQEDFTEDQISNLLQRLDINGNG